VRDHRRNNKYTARTVDAKAFDFDKVRVRSMHCPTACWRDTPNPPKQLTFAMAIMPVSFADVC
jgi:hypothetical protein